MTSKPVNRLQLQRRNAAGRANACLALKADGLQRDRVVRTAEQCVDTGADAERCVGGSADVDAAEVARRAGRRVDRPRQHGGLVDADVEADAPDRRNIAMACAGMGPENTLEVGERSNDVLLGDASAFKDAGLHVIGRGRGNGCCEHNGECYACQTTQGRPSCYSVVLPVFWPKPISTRAAGVKLDSA